ncbi:hypothetical protein PCYB_094540 [Plasmodium cynomolgi strain B]|uniref:Uncharacterized protein n=1 Tax=Plasmodium cynomolgi (strain B) TaxID=1120755 RepID=K6UWC3_PLACD|nr:hypothetical protein PCYB_094540 [Plasmodium cynomolgi strain B]GAB66670.1 hypothetical protein PCYB_094540 [Plasmodium cynomolgi strain B]
MYADRIRVACYGDKKIPSKLKYFFKEDLYELSDVKLDERINLLRIHLKYVFYDNPLSEKVTKYRRRDLLGRATTRVPPPGGAERGENQRGAQRDLVEEDNPKSDHNSSMEHAQRDATPRGHSSIPDKKVGKHKKSLISEFKEVFRKGVGNVDSAVRAAGLGGTVGEHMGQGVLGPDKDHLQDSCLEGSLKENFLKEDSLKENFPKEDYLKEDNLQDDGLLDDGNFVSESPTKTASNDLSTRAGHSSRGDHLGEFPDERDKITFLLKCCLMNKESYFAVYFYNLANLIKFLFERRSSFYQEEQKKNKNDKNVKKNNTNISKYLSLQKNIMKLGYKKNFSKKKNQKKLSSTLSEPSDGKNNNYSFYQHNDFYINVANIFKLSFVILKNIINSYKTDKLFEQRNAKKVYLLNFFLHYLEEKQFEKNIQKEDTQQVKNGKKNVYHTFPIYHIKFFSKNNEKEKNNLLISIMNKITNLCYRKYGNIALINKFFLAIILFENSKCNKSLKILKKIIQKCNHDFVIFFCMQLISFHKVNNQFYHFCSSFFLSNKYTPICSFKDININFAKISHYQDYLFFLHTKNSLLQIEQNKCYGNDFFSSLDKDIVVSYRNVMYHVLKSVARKGEMQLSTVHTEQLPHGKGTIQRGLPKEGEQIGGHSQKGICKGTTTPMDVNKNKIIKFERKMFYQNNYYFEPNARFLKSLRRFNFSVSKNDEQGEMHIPHSDVKVFVQSNYNLYFFASNMLFGNLSEADEEDEAGDPTAPPHIGTLLRLKIQKYAQKEGKGTGKIHPPRVKQLCVQYDENIDLFVFSALSQNLLIDNVMIELYDERENKKLHLNFAKNKHVIKTGLNLIKLNISKILECSQIKWKNFYYKINYVFLQVNHFCFYQQMGILPNGNILTPFLNVYTKFIKSNYILSDTNNYASFFLNQLISPLYIKIKTLQSVLNCHLVASYLNNTSLVYNSTNYVKLVVSNCHKHVDSREENEFITTQRDTTKGGSHVDIPTTSNSNQIKNVYLFVNNKNQGSNLQHVNEKCSLPDSVFFVIEANDHVQISEPKILKREDSCFTKPEDTSECPVEKEKGDYHDRYDYCHREERKKDSCAVISFVPVRTNNPNLVNSEQCELHFNSEKNLHSFDSPDGSSSNPDPHSRNNPDKVKIKCVINIDLGKKKRRQRKTDLYELSNVNYVGQTQFDHFINLEKDSSCHPPFNNQIVLEKNFHLANIFNEKIKTYRSKNTMLYELILNLHKDNYSVFLKKFHESGASSLSLLSANDLNEEGGGKRNPSNEVSYFYDEIDINGYIHGGMSVFFLFEVTYGDAQENALHDNGSNGCDRDHNCRGDDYNGRGDDHNGPGDDHNCRGDDHNCRGDDHNCRDNNHNGTNLLIHESMTGTLCVTYEYRSVLAIKAFERSQKEYIYTLDVPIPPFLLPINVHYEIPKCGTLHTSLNVKIILSNNMREDIYMKYFVYLEGRKKKNGQSECDDEYNWLINGFKKKVLFLPKNSSHVINLIILPLKIGLINFPPILYYVKLNDRWVEVTEVLKKSESFQLIISPSLHFSPKVWQLA